MADFRQPPPLMGLAALADAADVIVECLPSKHFLEVAEPAIARGRIFMPLSVGALIDHMQLVERRAPARAPASSSPPARCSGSTPCAPPPRARSPPSRSSRASRPPVSPARRCWRRRGLSVDDLKAPLRVFAGSAREAIAGFPANVNVAVALSLAGIGPDRTQVEVWADPGVTRNTHTVRVTSDSSDLTMTIENIPDPDNPRTGRITALSVLAALRRLTSPLVVGS